MAKRPEAVPLESEPPALTREACLALLADIVRDPEVAIEDRVDALRVHSAIWGLNLGEVDRWRVFSALVNGADKVLASTSAVEAATITAK